MEYGGGMDAPLNTNYSVRILSVPHGKRELNVIVGKRSDGSDNVQLVRVPGDEELTRPFSSFRAGMYVAVILRHADDGRPYLELSDEYRVPRVDAVEDQTHEFKTSMFVAPENTGPGTDQMEAIAQTVASFMNTDGGTLYLGVEDKFGRIVGCRSDFDHLRRGVPSVRSFCLDESNRTYKGDMDGYRNKFKAIVEGYLEATALSYLGEIEEVKKSGRSYLSVGIKAAPDDKLVYFWKKIEVKHDDGTTESVWNADLYVRCDNGKKKLKGKSRDEFVMARLGRHLGRQIEALQAAKPGVTAAELAEQLKVFLQVQSAAAEQPVAHRAGFAHAFTEAAIADITELGVLYYKDGTDEMKSVRLAKSTYQELYVALLKILNELDAEKFAALPDNADFMPQRKGAGTPPNFARRASGRGAGVHMKNASEYIGAVRANLQGVGKASFFDPKKLPLRLMAHFGVSMDDFSVGK